MGQSTSFTPTIRPAEWDSSFFGLRIGRLAPDADERTDVDAVARLDRSAFDCVWVDLDAGAAHLLRRWFAVGAVAVDVRIELAAPLTVVHTPVPGVELIGRWSERDREAITALAVEQSNWSRFARDPAFAPAVARLYRGWVAKVFDGKHQAFVWRDAGHIVGMLTSRRTEGVAWLELFDVAAPHRGGGIGRALVSEFLRKARADGLREARVRTQLRNVAAIRTYERAGFTVERATFVLHWWAEGSRRDALEQIGEGA